uniref:D7-related salivary protein n=1 Tax=Culicoides nubeculosus TaxID=144565 RepID=B9URK5_CULNU|nr:D7-related salivary protein [Culicoides nubeculosus]
MKFIILIFTIISLALCAPDEAPSGDQYDTDNLLKVRDCEEEKNLPASEKAEWWDWKVPANPTECYIDCIFQKYGWLSGEGGSIVNSAVEASYAAVGHSNPSLASCNPSKSGCSKADELYACLLNADGQKFKDAFDGKRDAK